MIEGSFLGNIIGTFYFISFIIAGILLAQRLIKKETANVSVLLGCSFGIVLFHWLPTVFSFLFSFNLISHIASLIVVVLIVIVYYLRTKKQKLNIDILSLSSGVSNNKGFLILYLIFITVWIYLLYVHALKYVDDGSIHTTQCGYGDMNMHLGFITSIANQHKFPPDYSIFPGVRLGYPFLCDSISSSVYIFGASLKWSYILPMIVAFSQIICFIYLISKTFLKTTKKALVSVLFYLLNGGFGIIYFFNWSNERKYTFNDIFTGFYTIPTNLVNENIRWVNIINDMFLPQRATLFGYATLFPAIYLLYKATFERKKEYYKLAAVLGCSLPLIHTHSFLAFALICVSFLAIQMYCEIKHKLKIKVWMIFVAFVVFMVIVQRLNSNQMISSEQLTMLTIGIMTTLVIYLFYLLYQIYKKGKFYNYLKTWGLVIIAAVLFAFPQLIAFTFKQTESGGFVRGYFNWGNLGDIYPWFYIKNIGVVLILYILEMIYSKKSKKLLFVPVIIIWFLAEMIAFAPNTYDNNKLLYVAYLFMCIGASDFLCNTFDGLKELFGKRTISSYVYMVLILLIASISGTFAIIREAISDYEVYGADQVDVAMWIDENADSDTMILTSDRHNNSIASLTGRNIVCGADTFLFFHGIDTSERKEEVKAMYEHPKENRELFEKYGVEYICCSPYEYGNYEIDENAIGEIFEKVFEIGNTRLYKTVN